MLKVRLRRAPRRNAALRAIAVAEGAGVPHALRAAAAAARFTGAAAQRVELSGPEGSVLLVGAGPAKRLLDWEMRGRHGRRRRRADDAPQPRCAWPRA